MGSIPQIPNASLRNTVPRTYMLIQKTTVRSPEQHLLTVALWTFGLGGALGTVWVPQGV